MDENKILTRSEISEEYKWDLTDLYESDEAWLEALKSAEGMIEKTASFRGRIMESADTLLEFLKYDDECTIDLNRLACYSFRKHDEDSTVAKYQDFESRTMNLVTRLGAASAFVAPEIIAADDKTLEKFYAEKPELLVYKRSLDKIRLQREHTLSNAEEAIMASAGNIEAVPSDAFEMLTTADLKFPPVVDKDGKEQPLTNGNYVTYLESSDRDIRKQAFDKLYHTYEQYKNTLATLYFGEVKQRMFIASSRKYPSALDAALSRNEVPTSVYHNLIDAVHKNMSYMHKYMKLRKKLLGVDELHMYDVYVPIVDEAKVKVGYEQAKSEILDAMKILGKDYTDMLEEGFNNRWIDVYENTGKRSGAYSAGARPHPYVLLNHKDTLDSEFTLVHEMGHALHSYLSMKNQPVCTSDYVIFVAEVASTCNEALLMQYLLGKTTDKSERAYLINYFLEQFRTTLYRQTMFAEFELLTNEMSERGETLTADALCELYHKLNVEYYGEDMVVDREIDFEWSRVPHFYYNFYVFQYATGFSAAIALSQRIIKEGEPAVRDYLKFLSSGSSTDPISLLKIAGVDMNSPEPVAQALELFGKLIDELDELLG